MTFSAPKSVSVHWALSDADKRPEIERAQRIAVASATKHLEQMAAFARRGKGGAIREPAAGLLMAKFEHHTSRELDPQLHTHVFVFNLAPRKDGTWGAIVSRELYKAQKQAGAIYRAALAVELERQGYAIERAANGFRVASIPRHVERALLKRRQAIEAAAEAHGYRSPKGMEQAALRTRRAKNDVRRDALFETWRAEARALGLEFRRMRSTAPIVWLPATGHRTTAPSVIRQASAQQPSAQIGAATGKLGNAARAMDQCSSMPGLAVDLKRRDRQAELG